MRLTTAMTSACLRARFCFRCQETDDSLMDAAQQCVFVVNVCNSWCWMCLYAFYLQSPLSSWKIGGRGLLCWCVGGMSKKFCTCRPRLSVDQHMCSFSNTVSMWYANGSSCTRRHIVSPTLDLIKERFNIRYLHICTNFGNLLLLRGRKDDIKRKKRETTAISGVAQW